MKHGMRCMSYYVLTYQFVSYCNGFAYILAPVVYYKTGIILQSLRKFLDAIVFWMYNPTITEIKTTTKPLQANIAADAKAVRTFVSIMLAKQWLVADVLYFTASVYYYVKWDIENEGRQVCVWKGVYVWRC